MIGLPFEAGEVPFLSNPRYNIDTDSVSEQ